MELKKNGYASKGTTYFYHLKEPIDILNKNQTKTLEGYVEWNVMCNSSEAEKVTNAAAKVVYAHSNGDAIVLVVYEN